MLDNNINDIKKQLEGMGEVDYDKIIEAERKGSNRKSLVAWLESRREI